VTSHQEIRDSLDVHASPATGQLASHCFEAYTNTVWARRDHTP
jgi:hypothetical protein